MNFYKVLGVNQKAGPDKIKRAYRKAAKRFHPDVSPRNGEKFREVQEAYETLSDPKKKALYDREVLEDRSPAVRPQSYYSHPSGSVPSSLFNQIEAFRVARPGRSRSCGRSHHNLREGQHCAAHLPMSRPQPVGIRSL